MFRKICWFAWIFLTAAFSPVVLAQSSNTASQSRPAPHITGSFIDTDGKGRLRLHYVRNREPRTFIGVVQATCMIPDQSKTGEGKPLDLATIPLGTRITAYFVRRRVGKGAENEVLAIRFESVLPGSTLPQGLYIPCFKAAASSASK